MNTFTLINSNETTIRVARGTNHTTTTTTAAASSSSSGLPTPVLAIAVASPPVPDSSVSVRRSGGHLGGVPGRKLWSQSAIDILLNVVEVKLPLGGDAWEEVARLFNTATGMAFNRDGDQCKEKFRHLHNSKGQTGDPQHKASVERAKQIKEAIENKAAIREAPLPLLAGSELDEEEKSEHKYDEENMDDIIPSLPALSAAAAESCASRSAAEKRPRSSSSSSSSSSTPINNNNEPARKKQRRERIDTQGLIQAAIEREEQRGKQMQAMIDIMGAQTQLLVQLVNKSNNPKQLKLIEFNCIHFQLDIENKQ